MSIPEEIINQMNKNRHFDNIIEQRVEKDWVYKKMVCGCEFGNRISQFGFSNRYCHEHAPKTDFTVQEKRQIDT